MIERPSLPTPIENGPNRTFLVSLRQMLDRILRKIIDDVNGMAFEPSRIFGDTGQPAYQNGWAAGTTNPSARFSKNRVEAQIMGEMKKTSTGNVTDGMLIARLPSGYVPRITADYTCRAVINAGPDSSVSIRIQGKDASTANQGKIEWYGGTVLIPASSVDRLSLAGIQFAIDED